jgi:hypothetical protein
VGIRKAESRIPIGFQASDLGEAVTADDGSCVLISYITSPLVTDRSNSYALFVTDPTVASTARTFRWCFGESEGAFDTFETDIGTIEYAPQGNGTLFLTVSVLDAAGAEQASVSMNQDIVWPNNELEILIEDTEDQPGPGMGNLEVIRELINDHVNYYRNVQLQTPEASDSFQKVVFGLARDGILAHSPKERAIHLDAIATSLNNDAVQFAELAQRGVGVCAIRLALLAMVLPKPGSEVPLLPWTELPEGSTQRAAASIRVQQALASLDNSSKIDLFNIARFPKSNITSCARIVEALRDRYFKGSSFDEVLTGMSGTRAAWISRHFTEGPLTHT